MRSTSWFLVALSLALSPVFAAAPRDAGAEPEALLVGLSEIKGRVVDSDKTPNVKLAVRLVSVEDGKLLAAVQTDEAGKFVLAAQKPGTYMVTFGRANVQGRLKVVAGGETDLVEVLVPRKVLADTAPTFLMPVGSVKETGAYTAGPGRFVGVLTDKNGKSRMAKVPVRLLRIDNGAVVARVTTDQDGVFDLGEVKEGKYTIAIGYATVWGTIRIQAGRQPGFLQSFIDPALLQAGRTGELLFPVRSAGLVFIPTVKEGALAGIGNRVAPDRPAGDETVTTEETSDENRKKGLFWWLPGGYLTAGLIAAGTATAIAVPIAVSGGGGGGGGEAAHGGNNFTGHGDHGNVSQGH